jgi:FHS family L-fucose permease-like MFS transporter
MERIGYKRGILTGLFLCAAGALLFLPAANSRLYVFFLFALFVMASGQSFLEVAANPYVTTLGPTESAERRLNLTQSFNAVGAVVTPIIGAAFILTAVEYTPAQLQALSPAQIQAYRAAQVSTVRLPYLVIAAVFIAVAGMIYFTHLPELHEHANPREARDVPRGVGGVLAHGHLVRGVLAQFFYVGAQVGVASFIIRFAQHVEAGLSAKDAAKYLQFHVLGFMIGRFLGTAMMKRIPAPRLLALFAGGSLICAVATVAMSGFISIAAIVLIGFFHSIMFPTIFALSIKDLGPYTKRASSLLVMAISGGAVVPAIMGKISDVSSIQTAFVVPLLCYCYVLYFGIRGYKPDVNSAGSLPRLEETAAS